jgi:hypothetical protein
MHETWLRAAGATGIPFSVLIGLDGRVVWTGNPHELNLRVLEAVLAGTYTLPPAGAPAVDQQEWQKAYDDALAAAKAQRWEDAGTALSRCEALDPTYTDNVYEVMHLRTRGHQGDWPKVLARLTTTVRQPDSTDSGVMSLASIMMDTPGVPSQACLLAHAWAEDVLAKSANNPQPRHYLQNMDAYGVLAQAKALLGERAEAIALLEARLAALPPLGQAEQHAVQQGLPPNPQWENLTAYARDMLMEQLAAVRAQQSFNYAQTLERLVVKHLSGPARPN